MEIETKAPQEQPINFNALNENQKEQFLKIVYQNCGKYVDKFLKRYESDIKKELSNSASKYFNNYLKKKNISLPYLKILISKLPENLQNIFVCYSTAGLFSNCKEIVNDIIKKHFFDANKILQYIAKQSKTDKKNILKVFDTLSLDLGISEQVLILAEKTNKINKLEKDLETQKQITSELEKEYKANKKEWTKKVTDKEKEIKDKDEEIKKLTEQVGTLKTIVDKKEINAPFRELDLKIDNEPSNDYILTSSGVNDDRQDDLSTKNAVLTKSSKKTQLFFDEDEFISNVQQNAKFMHLFYRENDLKNFHVAIKSSSLVILAGPSGIGKTKLPLIYANTLGLDAEKSTILFVPISPSYLEPEDVLGYVKPLQNSDKGYNAEFIESQTGLVSFLIDAQENKDKIHLVIFDEMNLSQIEHWFAPFLSLLEQDLDSRVLHLYSNNLSLINGEKFTNSIKIGENVFFVGTINIDETTKHISDRLLDRAIVINLAAPSFTDLRDIGTATTKIYQDVPYSSFASSVAHIDNAALEFSDAEFDFINELNDELIDSIYGKGISFRSLNKIATYLKNSKGILERKDAFDFAIAQMVIQKISGSSDDLKDLLTNNDNEGLLCILKAYPDVSDFERSKKAIFKKVKEIERYGFTR